MCRVFVVGLLVLAALLEPHVILQSAEPVTVPKGPLSPEESLKHLVLADPNLQIEIVAAEPEVIDPVSIQFDEHGRLWVVEMRDYPTGPKEAPPPLGGPEAKPLSRIKLLEDKDGDGRFETAHVFAENLLFATGVQPWDGGVIVTHSGEIVYLKDTDGDHKADIREVWFTGFSETNTQLRANHPTFGPDGWIYVANGLRGGNVIAVKKDWPVKVEGLGVSGQGLEKDKAQTASAPPHSVSHDPANPRPVSLTGRDFKFDPLTGRYEAISGNGQYGLTFDAWGNRFVCDNRHPCRHVIFEEDFIRRCPHVAFPAVVNDVIPPDDKNQVFPLTSAWTTSNLHAGTFTAACGVCVYTGDWLPEEFRGNVFVCEPTGNLVQRAILEPDGVTFKSHRGAGFQPARPSTKSSTNSSDSTSKTGQVENLPHVPEFLASRDDWFRPVDLQNGPDGALYVVDMYRAVIEHPEWVPDELKKRPDTWLGNDKGRIYRIRPKGERQKPVLRFLDVAKSLAHPNHWVARTVLRLEREHPMNQIGIGEIMTAAFGKEIADVKLRTLALGQKRFSESEESLLAANYFDRLDAKMSNSARLSAIQAIPVAKQLFAHNQSHEVVLHYLPSMAIQNLNDPWMQQAIVAVAADQSAAVLCDVLRQAEENELLQTEYLWQFVRLLSKEIGKRGREEDVNWSIARFADLVLAKKRNTFGVGMSGLIGIADGLSQSGRKLDHEARSVPELARSSLRRVEVRTVALLVREELAVNEELLAIRWLRYLKFENCLGISLVLFDDKSQEIRLAVVESFASFNHPDVAPDLIGQYPKAAPVMRRAILTALMASKDRQLRLLEAIEQGQIAATELGPVQANQLTQSKDETVRERAKTILAAAAPASRKEVLEAYQPALSLTGDAKRGRELFVKNCTTCHRVDNVGVNVAPDISDTRTKKPEQLLLDILDPNKAIDANYFAYAVVTKEGKVESGVISAETATSITLRQPEGKTLTLLRTDIEELKNTGLSLMPIGVEKNLDQQAMADLIFWLKNWRYLNGKVPATSLK